MENQTECYTTGQSAQERGLSHVPLCYEVPTSQRPTLNSPIAHVPVIDVAGLRMGPAQRSSVIHSIGRACRRLGFFHVVNHGIQQPVMDRAIAAADKFFKLPAKEKMKFMSSDVHKPVRYATSLKDGTDKIQFWRVFLKTYANPLQQWIQSWPHNPPTYRENMGEYSAQVHKVAMELSIAITESLGLDPKYLNEEMNQGMQVIASNLYPPCPQPYLTLGLPPHTDYCCLTMLLQSSPGLEIQDAGTWKLVPQIDGALQVHIGDHFEVLSNGLYKSVVHRAILNTDKTRLSIASLHSMGLDDKMEPALDLITLDNPKRYKPSSFRDFLNFLTANDLAQGNTSFLDTLKL